MTAIAQLPRMRDSPAVHCSRQQRCPAA
jgi:hypothetical protein